MVQGWERGLPLPSLQVVAVMPVKTCPKDALMEAVLLCKIAWERVSGPLLRADKIWKLGDGLFITDDSVRHPPAWSVLPKLFYFMHQHLPPICEPDILDCELKWVLGSITMNKASGGDGIPVELFQILKDDALKVLHSICQQIWKTQQWPQDWKRSVFIPIPKKGNAKECSNYRTIALISHVHKVMLKIL